MAPLYVSGTEPEGLIDIGTESQDEQKIGELKAEVVDNSFNRGLIEQGAEVLYERPSKPDFAGVITSTDYEGDAESVTFGAMDDRVELKHIDLQRVFYNRDSGLVVRDAVEQRAEALEQTYIHQGNDTADWESDFDEFGLYGGRTTRWETGGDLVFAGIRSGSSGSYAMRYTGVTDSATPESGKLIRLETRVLGNGRGADMSLEVEYVDTGGTSYVWSDLGIASADFEEYSLDAQDAEPGDNPAGTLEYRVDVKGTLTENRGFWVDYARTTPFRTTQRDAKISAGNIEPTGREITRRFTGSAFEMLQDLGEEERFNSWVEGDLLFFEPVGSRTRDDRSIVRGTTPVADISVDKDSEGVVNEVPVRGDGFDVVVRDSASIDFYGVAPRSEPVTDTSLKTEQEGIERGRGVLSKRAWDDQAVEVEVADSAYEDLRIGDAVPVDWPTQNLDATLIVTEKSTDRSGLVSLTLGGQPS